MRRSERGIWIMMALILAVGPGSRSAAYATESGATRSAPSVEVSDTVTRLEEQQDRYRVLFRRHAGVYYLSKRAEGFSRILAGLEQSRDAGKNIRVQVNADSMEIFRAP